MTVKLFDNFGRLMYEAWIPDGTPKPDVIVWSDHHFLWSARHNEYRQTTAYLVM